MDALATFLSAQHANTASAPTPAPHSVLLLGSDPLFFSSAVRILQTGLFSSSPSDCPASALPPLDPSFSLRRWRLVAPTDTNGSVAHDLASALGASEIELVSLFFDAELSRQFAAAHAASHDGRSSSSDTDLHSLKVLFPAAPPSSVIVHASLVDPAAALAVWTDLLTAVTAAFPNHPAVYLTGTQAQALPLLCTAATAATASPPGISPAPRLPRSARDAVYFCARSLAQKVGAGCLFIETAGQSAVLSDILGRTSSLQPAWGHKELLGAVAASIAPADDAANFIPHPADMPNVFFPPKLDSAALRAPLFARAAGLDAPEAKDAAGVVDLLLEGGEDMFAEVLGALFPPALVQRELGIPPFPAAPRTHVDPLETWLAAARAKTAVYLTAATPEPPARDSSTTRRREGAAQAPDQLASFFKALADGTTASKK
jgi:hypothetical protein